VTENGRVVLFERLAKRVTWRAYRRRSAKSDRKAVLANGAQPRIINKSGISPSLHESRTDKKKAPHRRGFPSAPERTRASTDQSVHKALNPGRTV